MKEITRQLKAAATQRTVHLSEATNRVCATYWNQPTRCKACPIQSVCHEPVQPLTYQTLDSHTLRLNAAAEQFEMEAIR